MDNETLRIINVYRSFKPMKGLSQKDKLRHQFQILRAAYSSRSIILSNFNLDLNRLEDNNIAFKNYFEDMITILGDVVLEHIKTSSHGLGLLKTL
jgi:hypothetical protein